MKPIHSNKREVTRDGKPDPDDEQNSFVLSCFRMLGPAAAAEHPLDRVRDWNLAVKALERNGLLPLIGLLSAGDAVPAGVQQQVLRNKLRMALYQSNTLAALADVDRELKAAAIPYAVLKGAYLYEWLYPHLFPRDYGDTDLLVPADRVEDAILALEKAGYAGPRKRSHRSSVPRWHFHVTLISEKPGGLPVELHRSLVDNANLYRVRDADLFARLREFKARGNAFTVLSAEDQLIYLCLHAAKHGILNFFGLRGGYAAEWYCRLAVGNRLIWFLDIELFLRQEKDNLNWPVVSERAKEWNVWEDVMNCLRVLHALLPGSQAEYAMERLGCPARDAGATPDRRPGLMDRLLGSRAGQVLLERSMLVQPRMLIRPVRFLLLWRILVPSPARLLSYHGRKNRLWIPWLYLMHPFHMICKMFALCPTRQERMEKEKERTRL